MNFKGRTTTEVSGMTAIAVAVSLALEGMLLPAGVALLMGVALLVVYEYLGSWFWGVWQLSCGC